MAISGALMFCSIYQLDKDVAITFLMNEIDD